VSEYQRLDSALHAARAQTPIVRWDALAARLSDAVHGAEEAEEPVSYKLFNPVRKPMWIAAAASVMLAAGIGITLLMSRGQSGSNGQIGQLVPPPKPGLTPPPIVQIAQVEVVGPEIATDRPVAEIEIGPSAALTKMDGGGGGFIDVGIADDLSSRPSRTVIASGMPTRQEIPLNLMPF
jgi:hypothetical protein